MLKLIRFQGLTALAILITFAAMGQKKEAKKSDRPNIVIILSDDQGYADVSFQQNPAEVSTPAIDKLAADGVVFTNAYVSAYVCAPTRAGLLTGRYQQRFGFYRAPDSRKGMSLEEITLADMVRKEGYKTGIFGKWHLGIEPPYHPLKRGFDEFYGFLGHGGHDYFDLGYKPGDDTYTCIYRNNEPVSDTGYLTDNLAREASSFIEKHTKTGNPFFLYLPFNAVHAPVQAPQGDINRFNTGDKDRDIQLAMLYRLDIAIGQVINTLKKTGAYDNTLLFFLTDNGGAKVSKANNFPLRDFKHSVYEGGIRVPFIVSWPRMFEPAINHQPVISLDILPTVCAAAGIILPDGRDYDGKSILPVISGKQKTPLHPELFWDGNDGIWAARQGKWKLVFPKSGKLELYDLEKDISEQTNVIDANPQVAQTLRSKYEDWRSQMISPMNEPRRKK